VIRLVQTRYDRLAGKSLERLAALSDGLFSVAMTILVLDLRVPDVAKVVHERDLLPALSELVPRLITYFMSLMTLGIFWVGQQTIFNHLERCDRHFAWLTIAFLGIITLIPFSTALLATYITFRMALFIYWANIFLLGITVLICWRYALSAKLVKADVGAEMNRAIMQRLYESQALYALATLLSFVFNNWVGIGLIVLVQLSYAIGPKLRPSA
jgi:uncharacterized membrane protein